jgi:hypothetical protein
MKKNNIGDLMLEIRFSAIYDPAPPVDSLARAGSALRAVSLDEECPSEGRPGR